MTSLVLEKHTDNSVWCWRVRDPETGETWGYGLTEADANNLRDQLSRGH